MKQYTYSIQPGGGFVRRWFIRMNSQKWFSQHPPTTRGEYKLKRVMVRQALHDAYMEGKRKLQRRGKRRDIQPETDAVYTSGLPLLITWPLQIVGGEYV